MSCGAFYKKNAQKIEGVWALIATHPSGQQQDVIDSLPRKRPSGGKGQWEKGHSQRLVQLINADFFDHASYGL
jgi:hypothetical protein